MEIVFPQEILKGTFSIPKKDNKKYLKCKIQRITIKNKECYQFAFFTETQVFHKNVDIDMLNQELNEIINLYFNSLEIRTKAFLFCYKLSKSGKLLTTKKKIQENIISLDHNQKKKYLLPEGQVILPLVDLGVMQADGTIVKARYDKYRQINRFLELIEDSISNETYLKIVDFGCGKSYLTFLLYYYLVYVKKISCDIIGMDLKEDVVLHCNQIADKYGYEHLHFLKGDISQFEEKDHIDMVVTLHACDTATDYALYHAIRMKCKYIFSVPCCQHEINLQMKSSKLHLVNKYGILKERLSAILTDALRANILQYYGYKTQVLEFIDMDASPKNILIRATYENLNISNTILKEIEELLSYFEINQKLYELTIGSRNE